MRKGKNERRIQSTYIDAAEREKYSDDPSDDSVVRDPSIIEIGHENFTLKLNCRAVNMSGLKRFAAENLPSNSRLRHVLLSERDQLIPVDFLAKMDVWMRLLDIEKADLTV